jgi:hypothetical protein
MTASILRLRALEQRRGPPRLTALQQRILENTARLVRCGYSQQAAIDAALDKEY